MGGCKSNTPESPRIPEGAWYADGDTTVWPDSMKIADRIVIFPTISSGNDTDSAATRLITSDKILSGAFNLSVSTAEELSTDPLFNPALSLLRANTLLDSLGRDSYSGMCYPVVNTKARAISEAIGIYHATANPLILKKIIPQAKALITTDRLYSFSDSLYLFTGADPSLIADDLLPGSVKADHLSKAISFSNNIDHAIILKFLAEYAPDINTGYKNMLDSLIQAIDINLWNPTMHFHNRLIIDDVTMESTDTRAQARAILYGISDKAIAAAVVDNLPMTGSDGIPRNYPGNDAKSRGNASTQALWGAAAGHTSSEEILSATLGQLILNSLNGNPEARIHLPSAIVRGMIGVRTDHPDYISFHPTIPRETCGEITLRNLRYRDATLNITIHGTGDVVTALMLDGTEQSSTIIPSTISGIHNIDITVADSGKIPAETTFATPAATTMTAPRQFQHSSDSVTILFTDFARPYARSLSDKGLSKSMVESTRFRNKTIPFAISAPSQGFYNITFTYLNGEGIVNPDRRYALRTLSANRDTPRLIVFPQLTPDDWRHDLDWQLSRGTTLPMPIYLNKGINTLSLDYFTPDIPSFNHDTNTLIPISATISPAK